MPQQHYRTTENGDPITKRREPRPLDSDFPIINFFSVTGCEGCESFVNTVVRENCFIQVRETRSLHAAGRYIVCKHISLFLTD